MISEELVAVSGLVTLLIRRGWFVIMISMLVFDLALALVFAITRARSMSLISPSPLYLMGLFTTRVRVPSRLTLLDHMG